MILVHTTFVYHVFVLMARIFFRTRLQ